MQQHLNFKTAEVTQENVESCKKMRIILTAERKQGEWTHDL